MRIGIDARLIRETGVGRYIQNLIKQLLIIDKKNTYVTFTHSLNKDFLIEIIGKHENWKIVATDIRWHSLEEQFLLSEVINRQSLDLMHFPYFSVPYVYNKPYIVTIHDLILHHFPTGEASTLPYWLYWSKLQAYKSVMKKSVEKAKKIITVSQATKKEIIDHFQVPSEKIVVTYEGADDQIRIMNNPSASSGQAGLRIKEMDKNRKYFLHVGNVYPHKNCDRLVDAFNIFSKTNSNVDLIFVGKPDYFFNKLQNKVTELGLSGKILFLGNVDDETLGWYYRSAVAVVIPSLMEGFGLPAIEAMTQKCLVIVSETAALREICRDGAIYCRETDVFDIADKLRVALLLPIKERKKFLERGQKVISEYSWKTLARETLKTYESCIGL